MKSLLMSLGVLFLLAPSLQGITGPDKKYIKAKTKVEEVMASGEYEKLWKVANDAIEDYRKDPYFNYAAAYAIFYGRDSKALTEKYSKENLMWKGIFRYLSKTKNKTRVAKPDIDALNVDQDFYNAMQDELYSITDSLMKVDEFSDAKVYYKQWFDYFDNKGGDKYTNIHADKVQKELFEYANYQYTQGSKKKAFPVYDLIFKFFHGTEFEYQCNVFDQFPDEDWDYKSFRHPKYTQANTSADADYLSDEEKKLVFLMNLARMNPALFHETFVKSHAEKHVDMSDVTLLDLLAHRLKEGEGNAQMLPNAKLTAAAKKHCEDMAKNDFVGHDGSDETTMYDRLDAVDYKENNTCAEVIAMNTTSSKAIDLILSALASTPQTDMTLHKENKTCGVSIVESDGKNYVTVVFSYLD